MRSLHPPSPARGCGGGALAESPPRIKERFPKSELFLDFLSSVFYAPRLFLLERFLDCMRIRNFVTLIISFSLFVAACGKEDPKVSQMKSLQGKWKHTQTSSCGTVTTIDPALAQMADYTDSTGTSTQKLSLTCTIIIVGKVSHPSNTSYSIESLTDVRFGDSSGCSRFGINSSHLDSTRTNFQPKVFSYTLNGNQLDVKQDQTCRNADGTTDFVHEIYTRQ